MSARGAGAKRAVIPAIASLIAALIGHVVIDVLGDVMLAHDTYDDIGHASRSLVALATALLTVFAAGAALRAAIREANGSDDAFCAAIRSTLPRSVLFFTVTTIAVATGLLCVMEGCDAVIAGQRVDDLADLFGGSVSFGATIVAITAALVAVATLLGLRRLARARIVAELLVAFLRRSSARVHAAVGERAYARTFAACTYGISYRVAGRAPPLVRSAPTA